MITCSCSASSHWWWGTHNVPSESLLAQAGLSGLSGEMLLSLYLIGFQVPRWISSLWDVALHPLFSGVLSFFRANAHKKGMMSGIPSAGCAVLLHYQPQTDGRCCSLTPGGSITNPFQHPPPNFSKDPVTLGGKKQHCIWFTINRIYK